LVKLGTPINIVQKSEKKHQDGGHIEIIYGPTPLETALWMGCTKIAAMLIRLEGFARESNMNETSRVTLESAKKELMTEQEMLFKAQMTRTEELTKDTSNYILSISQKLYIQSMKP